MVSVAHVSVAHVSVEAVHVHAIEEAPHIYTAPPHPAFLVHGNAPQVAQQSPQPLAGDALMGALMAVVLVGVILGFFCHLLSARG